MASNTTAIVLKRKAPVQIITTRRPKKKAKISHPKKKKHSARRTNTSLALPPPALAYARVLADPFSYPPVSLGFGCLTRTQLVTLTARVIASVGTDGHLSAFVIPAVGNSTGASGLYYSNSVGGATLSSTREYWQNEATVVGLLEEARVVACGLRAFPQIPGTASPGAAFVASLPSTSFNQLDSSSKNSMVLSPMFKWGYGSSGASAFSRPVDPDSFNFHHNLITGIPGDVDSPVTTPVIVFNGLPVGSSVLIEATLQLEGLMSFLGQSQVNTGMNSSSSGTSLSQLPRHYSSVESLWSAVTKVLPPPATVRGAAQLSNALLSPAMEVLSDTFNPPTQSPRRLH